MALLPDCNTHKTMIMLLAHVKRKLAASKGKDLVELELLRTYKPKREHLHYKDLGIGSIKSMEPLTREKSANGYRYKCIVEFKYDDVVKYISIQESLRKMTEDDY